MIWVVCVSVVHYKCHLPEFCGLEAQSSEFKLCREQRPQNCAYFLMSTCFGWKSTSLSPFSASVAFDSSTRASTSFVLLMFKALCFWSGSLRRRCRASVEYGLFAMGAACSHLMCSRSAKDPREARSCLQHVIAFLTVSSHLERRLPSTPSRDLKNCRTNSRQVLLHSVR